MNEEPQNKAGYCSINAKWCCTFEGIFKLVEFFTVLLSWVICNGVYNEVDDAHITSRFIYFLVIGIICWIFTMVVILIYFFGCFGKYIDTRLEKSYGWYIFLLSASLVWFFFWLFTAVLLVFYYKFWVGLLGAAFFGFVNVILFLIDSITYYRLCRKYRITIRKRHRSMLESQAM